MELKVRKNKEVYIIDVSGEMDLYNSYRLKELVMKMIERQIKCMIINLEDVDYIDSSGIGALIYICSTVKKMNLRLFITNRTDKADGLLSHNKQLGRSITKNGKLKRRTEI